MDSPQPDVRLQESLARYGRAAVTVALAVAALDWVGWTCGIEPLTRINRAWPQMMPWTALWLAALAAAIAAQSGRPSRARVWAGRGLAVAVGILAAVVLAEYATGRSFGLDEVWFTETVRALHWSWPGRPSSPTALAVLPVAAAVALMRLDRGTSGAWAVCVAAGGTIAFVSVAAYLFDAVSLVGVTPSRGQSISTALTLLLLVTASAAARPDRFPFAWLLARPDRRSLVRLLGILAGFPVVVALSRATFLAVGVGEPTEWSLSIVVGTLIAGAVTFYLSQREQRLLIEKELVSKKRADAEARYRILADNAVDVIVHLRGSEVAWISPSVEAALGGPPQQWIGADPSRRIHADDVDAVVAALGGIAGGGSVLRRFRVRSADGDAYHWVDSHAKPYVDAEGNTDGVIAALRVVDDQVEAEQRLERLARFDALTGLANRAEAIERLESALHQAPTLGAHLGILFCDIDRFKDINDTWGDGVGDAVLTTLAARIRDCVREGDTVGRTGGDEILVLLPDVKSDDALARIAEKIRLRAAEPIRESGCTIFATLSIGATMAVPGEAVSSLTARADAAMYQAKQGDRNTVVRI